MATTPCPHCAAETITLGDAFARAFFLRGTEFPFQCSKCKGLSYLPMTGPNGKAALALLVVGIVLSLPPVTELIWAKRFAVLASLAIFSIAHLASFATLVLAGEVRKLEEPPIPRFRPARTLFLAGIAAYMFYLCWTAFKLWTVRHAL